MKYYLGLMSGTSMDGIDAAIVDVVNHNLIQGITVPYTQNIKEMLHTTQKSKTLPVGYLSQLNVLLGESFALAAKAVLAKASLTKHAIHAIGSHGQTIVHAPQEEIPYTLQLGCGHTIAEKTGIAVVADFRTRDLVLGGQGAPFAPLYHHELWGSRYESMAIVNIGGIANVTFLNAHGALLGGYDIGPGNVLMDAWTQINLHKAYDESGLWAQTGSVNQDLLSLLLADDFFTRAAPKSICNSYYSLQFLYEKLSSKLSPEDIQATLTMLTATSIAKALHAHNLQLPLTRVLVCGGGVHNQTLMRALQAQLSPLPVSSTQTLGVSADFLEAMMFAWLASRTINSLPIDATLVTGARKSAILGAIYPAGIDKLI